MQINVPDEWGELARSLASEKGTSLILGSTDTGKSTLVRYLTETLIHSGVTVTLVDADIGQSSLCLPGTVSIASFRSPEDAGRFSFGKFTYLGAVSPVPVMPFLIRETCRYVSFGRHSSDITLIDTTGLVNDEPGKRLKTGKIKAVQPDFVIALERDGELEHILEQINDIDVVRLRPSPHAKTRSMETRARYRRDKFSRYFKNTGEILLRARPVEFFFQDRPEGYNDLRIKPGTIVGLSRDADTDGLGIVTETDTNSILLRTPLSSLKGIKRVVFGTVSAEDI